MNAKGKILVVDDDRLVLATVTHGLAQAGYEVIDADNGDDAILLARQHKPELALSAGEPLADIVGLAAGVLMHRYSLSRGEALARLRRIADAAKVPLAEQAERLVRAVEELARPGS